MEREREGWLLCGRRACDNPADPRGWNNQTGLMYCAVCASKIRMFGGDFFPLLGEVLRGPMAHGARVRVRDHQVEEVTDG